MFRSFYITLLASVVICAIILVAQSRSNFRINEHIDSERTAITNLKKEPFSVSVSEQRILTLNEPLQKSADVEATPPSVTEGERVKETCEVIKGMVAGIENFVGSPAELFKILPDIFRLVEDFNLKELMEVVETFEISANQQSQSGESGIRMILSVLIADEDPLLVIQNAELMEDREIRRSAIGSLGRRDPKAALEWIKSSATSGVEVHRLRKAVLSQAFAKDVEAGVRLLCQLKEESDYQFAAVSLPSERLPELGKALKDPNFQTVERELTQLFLLSAILESGVAGVRETIGGMDLDERLIANSIESVLDQSKIMRSEPEEAVAWLSEVQSPEQLEHSLPSALSAWAATDYNAAGEWLGKMEPSAAKDNAVSAFALTVVPLDPEAATMWSIQIQDEEKRASAMRESITAWQKRDIDAANKWLEVEGLQLKDFED